MRIRHVVEGEGRPVVVMHGWGASIETVASIVSALSPACEVHALDLPGFGGSEQPGTAWGPYEYAGFLAAFMDAMGLHEADLVGHSNGGRVAIALAATQQARVRRMVLVDSAGLRPKRTLTYYRKVGAAKLGKHAAAHLGRAGERLRDVLVAGAASADYAAAPATMRKTFQALVNTDLRDVLPRIACPTLLIWGEHDTATPLADAKVMERLIPDAGLVVLEGAGHYSYLDDAARFARIVRHFLADGR